jgi:hypothetical protein
MGFVGEIIGHHEFCHPRCLIKVRNLKIDKDNTTIIFVLKGGKKIFSKMKNVYGL